MTAPTNQFTAVQPPAAADITGISGYTRQLVGAAFMAENTDRQAHRDPTALSMSGLGGCTRAAAYSTAGTPPSDVAPPEEAREAVLGTWLHDSLLPRLAGTAGPGTVVEHPVRLTAVGHTIPGTLDLAQAVTDGAPVNSVWDLKSVKEWRLVGVRRLDGAYTAHWLQSMGYALARYQSGVPVDWVIWLYMDRSTGEIHVEVEPFTNAAMLAVIDRVREITYWAETPDLAPRAVATVGGRNREYALMRGPGLSYSCDRCPWLRRCWGPTAQPKVTGAQRILAATPAGVEEALALYARGAELESAGRADKEYAKAVLADTPDDRYGRWVLRRGKPGQALDQGRARELLTEHGLPVPMVPKAGSISVRPAAQEA